MATLKELQKENARLRGMQTQLKDMQKNNVDRRNLLKENKKLAREIKFGKAINISKRAQGLTREVGKRSGKVLAKVGIGAFKGLQKYGTFLAEQEREQRSVNTKLKSVKKAKSSRKTKRR